MKEANPSKQKLISAKNSQESVNEVRAIRRQLNLSVATFAAKLGVSAVTITRWERGLFTPRRETFERIRALGNASAQMTETAYILELGVEVVTADRAVEILTHLKRQLDTHAAIPKLVRATIKRLGCSQVRLKDSS